MAVVTLERTAPLVVHLIYRLDIGGLETLLVDTINRMPADRYRHAIVCLTDYTDFAERIAR
ncbi:MAG: glycosyl transferase group 1 protein, partial [Telluria sp.]